MTENDLGMRIKARLDRIPNKYDTKGEYLLYQQGILLGLLAKLALQDSHNLDLILQRLKDLDTNL
jgi:hypothetical protein